MKVILISCASQKLSNKTKAKKLYVSPLFKLNYKYAQSLNPDKIFILSAKYGLLGLDKEVEPYDQTLNSMSINERKEWADKILKQLKNEIDFKNDEVIFLAGEKYREYLVPYIKNYKVPMYGLGIGKQLQFLKNELS